jgi:hypothetical protein
MANLTTLYRDRISKERGTITKDWGGKTSVALIYPNYYHIGMSNLGFHVVYGILNDYPAIVSERVFLPEEDELSLYKRTDQPLLSLESQTPLGKFDLLAFSLSFENDYPHVLTMLDLGKIPLASKDRGDDYPLVWGCRNLYESRATCTLHRFFPPWRSRNYLEEIPRLLSRPSIITNYERRCPKNSGGAGGGSLLPLSL